MSDRFNPTLHTRDGKVKEPCLVEIIYDLHLSTPRVMEIHYGTGDYVQLVEKLPGGVRSFVWNASNAQTTVYRFSFLNKEGVIQPEGHLREIDRYSGLFNSRDFQYSPSNRFGQLQDDISQDWKKAAQKLVARILEGEIQTNLRSTVLPYVQRELWERRQRTLQVLRI